MTFEADQIVDRRRLRRKLTFWRVAAFVIALIAILVAFGLSDRDAVPGWAGPQIARLTIDGFIGDNRRQTELIEKLTDTNAVKAVNYFTDLKTRHGLDIVALSNSWGGGGFSQSLLNAIVAAANVDILFVAAAGNGGSDQVGDNNDVVANYPSNYNTSAGAGYEGERVD